MEAVYWFGSHERLATPANSLWRSIAERLVLAFAPGMFAMTGLFGLIGGAIGFGFGLHASRLTPERDRRAPRADDSSLAALLLAGEGERIEFKATARWDPQLGRVNHALEDAVARTIAGFLNHRGGSLLLGVSDTAEPVGLRADYETLRRKDRDGLQQYVMALVESKPGGHVCPQLHIFFGEVGGYEICRILVEPSSTPIYFQDGSRARYYVRAGNGTRELDVREALVHLARRGRGEPTVPI
jgi:hypothetical protein